MIELNNLILNKLCELIYKFHKITKTNINNETVNHSLPNKYLQTLNPPKLPTINLHLKIGVPIILI